jgi:hypothetical protein
MPEILGYDHLFLYLEELGFASGGGMSIAPLTFTEIKNWSDLTGTKLSIFEAESLFNLTRVYVRQRFDSEDVNCPTPFSPEVIMDEDKRANVTNFFKNLAKTKKVTRQRSL